MGAVVSMGVVGQRARLSLPGAPPRRSARMPWNRVQLVAVSLELEPDPYPAHAAVACVPIVAGRVTMSGVRSFEWSRPSGEVGDRVGWRSGVKGDIGEEPPIAFRRCWPVDTSSPGRKGKLRPGWM